MDNATHAEMMGRVRRNADLFTALRLLGNISDDPETKCWNWQRTTTNGYGRIRVDGKLLTSHRVAYQLWKNKLRPGYEIDHLCYNRACCNPAHLEQVLLIVNKLRQTFPATRPQVPA